MTGHKTKINKRTVAYWLAEPPAGVNEYVFLIHGFGGTYSGLEEVAKQLNQDFGIIGVDLPGYGLSEPMSKQHTVRNYADFVYTLCKHIKIDKMHVVGHSFGADIALVLAARHPSIVDRLVLLHPVVSVGRVIGTMSRTYYSLVGVMPRSLRHFLLHNHMLTWVSDMTLFRQADTAHKEQILRDDYISDHLMSDIPTMEGYRSVLTTKFMQLAARIHATTFILSGDKDPLSPAAKMADLAHVVNHSRLEIVPGGGHFYPIERPKHASNRIRAFLAGKN